MMDKQKLQEMGLTEEQIKNVLDALKKGYVDKATLEQKTAEIKNLTEQVKERDTQIESLKKFEGDNSELQAKIKEMETTNKTKADEYTQTLLQERKKSAVRFALLEDEGGKPFDVAMVAGMFNLDNINLNEDGSIANGFKEQNETLRKDKAFLFNTVQQGQQNPGTKRVGNTPADGQKNPPPADTPENFGAKLAQNKLQMMGIKPKTEQ
jgi:predicted nuclease with TOPRIM domain